MDKKKFLLFILGLTLISILFLTGCQEKKPAGLVGTYHRLHLFPEGSHPVQLSFTDTGRLIWSPVDSLLGNKASDVAYEILADNHIRIFDDEDCGSEGIYSYSFTDKQLNIILIADDCSDRVKGLSGEWQIHR